MAAAHERVERFVDHLLHLACRIHRALGVTLSAWLDHNAQREQSVQWL